MLADPEMRKTFKTLMSMVDEQNKCMAASHGNQPIISGPTAILPLGGFGMMAGAPFDHFADALRGTHGIVRDMFRQPKKLHEAMEWYLNLCIEINDQKFPDDQQPRLHYAPA